MIRFREPVKFMGESLGNVAGENHKELGVICIKIRDLSILFLLKARADGFGRIK